MLFLLTNFILLFFWFNIILYFFAPNILRLWNYFILSLLFIIILFLNIFFNKTIYWYQYILTFYKQLFFNIDFTWGFDILSLNLILLCSFLLLFCYLCYWNLKYLSLYYFFLLNFSLWILINVFSSLDFFNFFIFFELIVIPMFLLIGIWGSRNRKITASYQLFIYTLFGSIFVFICIFDILLSKGNLSFDFFLYSYYLDSRQLFIWVLLFLGFSIKVPIVPLHLWLPEAHVEAPTPGSVILAGILLKLGTYAILRFLLGSFTIICYDLIFIVLIIALFSLTHSSIVALCQIDIKKIIAYSSVAHMNYSLLGLFSQSLLGLAGAYIMIFSHAITSSALFLGIGVLYDRYKTRLIFYYGGLVAFMPIFSIIYFIFILSNFGFPGTFNFIGEFLLTFGILNYSFFISFLSTFSLVLSLMYSLFLYNRIFFGFVKSFFIKFYSDITRLEFVFLIIFLIVIIIGGILPMIIFDNIFYYIYKLKFFII
jgi:proton-translocating NADH-quinone oxidoreductase chain M